MNKSRSGIVLRGWWIVLGFGRKGSFAPSFRTKMSRSPPIWKCWTSFFDSKSAAEGSISTGWCACSLGKCCLRMAGWQVSRFWLGSRGPIEWPSRSPDSTPCDFFLWGHLNTLCSGVRPLQLSNYGPAFQPAFARYPPNSARVCQRVARLECRANQMKPLHC